jgi:AcrR family transcriptional regulator
VNARPVARPPGRRPGAGNTREDVLAAARRLFAERGYDAASLRAIAAAADVDPGMVRHFFGNKAGLFRAVMHFPIDFETAVPALLAGGPDGLGERLARFLLSIWEDPANRGPALAMIRSAVSHEESARMLREFITEQLLARVAAVLDRPEPRLRATLTASQAVGLIMTRYVVRVEPLASADVETIVAAVAPTFQRYLTGEIGAPRT